METIVIDKEKAIKTFNNADEKGKALITELCGKDAFVPPTTIFDRVKTVADAFKEEGKNFEESMPFKNPQNNYEKYKNACEVVETVIKSLNEDWVPNMKDKTQRKYRLYVELEEDASKPSGFGFAGSNFGYDYDCTSTGSRLVFENPEKANHFLRYFEQEWCLYLTL